MTTSPSTFTPNRAHRAVLTLVGLLLASLGSCGGEGASSTSRAAQADSGSSGVGGLVILNPSSERDYFHDFESIPFGEVVTHVFQLENTDPVPVTILDLLPSCSCSTPIVSYRDENGELVRGNRRGKPVIVLPPGVVADVSIAVDTRHVRLKNVDKLAQVRLRSDSQNTPFITFEMHMIVELAFQATPPILAMKDVPVSGGGHISSDVITGVRGSGKRIVDVLEATPGLEVNIDAFEQSGMPVWRVSATLVPPLELGSWKGEIRLRTTGDYGEGEGRPFVIPVTAQIVEDIVVQPSTLGFTPFSPATGATANARLVALAPGHRIKVTDARIEGDVPEGLVLSYEPSRPDSQGRAKRWDVTLSAPPSYPRQRAVGMLVFELDDPNVPRVEARFVFLGSSAP